jgi:LmbE family N-acetylglucosaminyl deacetylase
MLQSGAIAAAAVVRGQSATILATKRTKVIVTGGHPGDPEYGCGGTIARLSELGSEIVLLYLNEGEPQEAAARLPKGTRVAEAKKACEILKARPGFAGQIDGGAIVDRAHYDAFRKIIESENPEAIFTHWPIDNHADHRAISMLVYDAWVRLKKSFALFYYEVSNGEDTLQFSPTHYVNISGVDEKKRAACYAHASQSPERFYQLQDTVARWRGLERGFTRAEAFVKQIQSKEFPLPN